MKRLFKSRKALSPVVAAIILIAVTVAVSIAVAAWMGALTFTFMQTEQISITSMQFNGNSGEANNTIVLYLKNTGSSKVTLTQVTLNDDVHTVEFVPTTGELEAAETGTATLTDVAWDSGNTYRVVLQSSTGTNVASYEKKAS
ncbi:MAG: flagellin [Candidatus Bathyarchaeota archaeon]|nr:flagellin [Candidatus Bathyarchaeota archaeon]